MSIIKKNKKVRFMECESLAALENNKNEITENDFCLVPLNEVLSSKEVKSKTLKALKGYDVLDSGMILQWNFTVNVTSGNFTSEKFAIAFPNACVCVAPTNKAKNDTGASANISNVTREGFDVHCRDNNGQYMGENVCYLALGY